MLKSYKELIESLNVFNSIAIIIDSVPGLMSAILYTFPETYYMLCLGHINKNVLINCRPGFENEEKEGETFNAIWHTILYVKTMTFFQNAGNAMKLKYQNEFVLMNYFEELIRFHKRKIIKCYTNRILYFGNISTSRSKSSHVKLKLTLKIFINMIFTSMFYIILIIL